MLRIHPLNPVAIGLVLLSATGSVGAQHFCDQPPLVTILTGESVPLTGLASEGHPVGFSWYVTAPGASVPGKPSATTPSIEVIPDQPGRWSVAMVADYDHEAITGGLWSSESCITIDATSVVASIALADSEVATDEELDINGFASRWASGVVPSVEWQVDGQALGACNGGPPPSTPGDLQCTIPANWLSPGVHTAGLQLTDPTSSETSLSTAEFEVIEYIPLSVEFGWMPAEPDPGNVVLYTATLTPATAEQDFTRVIWDLGDGFVETYTSCPPLFSDTCLEYPYIYAEDGWYDVSITVETADESTSRSHRVKIGDPADPPVASISANPASPLIMESTGLFFDGTCTGDCLWSWEFGDGGQSTIENPAHSWLVPTTYTVSLTVTNQAGEDSTSILIDVGNCWVPDEPIQEGACYGGPVTITAPLGTSWLWNTGATAQSIPAPLAGPHWVNANDGGGCWGHTPKSVVLDNCGDPDGDTNLDGVRDAADLSALIPEFTDGDGDAVSDAGGGDLTAPGGDITGDWNLRADDLLTVLVELFD